MQALAVREAARQPYPETADGHPSEDTELEELADEIALMAAHMHAYRRRYLERVPAEFDRRRGWEPGGHRSCADWLAFRAGLDLNTAREHVRVARALESLPRTGEAMGEGRLSFSQARALTRVATPEEEEALLELTEGCPPPPWSGWSVNRQMPSAETRRRLRSRPEGHNVSTRGNETSAPAASRGSTILPRRFRDPGRRLRR